MGIISLSVFYTALSVEGPFFPCFCLWTFFCTCIQQYYVLYDDLAVAHSSTVSTTQRSPQVNLISESRPHQVANHVRAGKCATTQASRRSWRAPACRAVQCRDVLSTCTYLKKYERTGIRRPGSFPGVWSSWRLQVACSHLKCWTIYHICHSVPFFLGREHIGQNRPLGEATCSTYDHVFLRVHC